MIIKSVPKQEITTINETVVDFSSQDISQILVRDAFIALGIPMTDEEKYDIIATVHTDAKYVTDEWGMNGHYSGTFTGITLSVNPKVKKEVADA